VITKGKLIVGAGRHLLAAKTAIRDEAGNLIASTSGTNTVPQETQEANAAELCRRWNCYDELVAAIEFMLESSGDADAARLPDAIERCEKALAAAKGAA
jgi:hypothetical protein